MRIKNMLKNIQINLKCLKTECDILRFKTIYKSNIFFLSICMQHILFLLYVKVLYLWVHAHTYELAREKKATQHFYLWKTIIVKL